MEPYLEAIDVEVYRATTQGFPKPREPANLVGDEVNYEKYNTKARNTLFRGLCKDVFNHVRNHKDTHSLWLDICVSPSPLTSSTRTFKHEYISLALSLESISNELSFFITR